MHQSPTLNIPGKGSAELTFDTETRKLDWTVEYSDLSGPPVMAHFHGPADKGQNADVAVPFEGDLASPIKGSVRRRVDGLPSPSAIRDIQNKLKLSQREAGELFKVGENAFDKYERGLVEPSGPTTQLMKLLNKHPELIKELR